MIRHHITSPWTLGTCTLDQLLHVDMCYMIVEINNTNHQNTSENGFFSVWNNRLPETSVDRCSSSNTTSEKADTLWCHQTWLAVKSPTNAIFSRKVTDKGSIFHCHVWLLDRILMFWKLRSCKNHPRLAQSETSREPLNCPGCGSNMRKTYLVGGFNPSENMKVNWDDYHDYSIYLGK